MKKRVPRKVAHRPNNGLLLDVSGAARLMGISRGTVRLLCNSFELPWMPRKGKKIGRWIPRPGIDAWIERNTVRSESDLRRLRDGRRSASI